MTQPPLNDSLLLIKMFQIYNYLVLEAKNIARLNIVIKYKGDKFIYI